ncbi:hybrid sensor histidine kinase/response regulator [Pasteurellaceae bacterium Macca]|nr:hybrid sensor histidine kinase/response regulator [Pasteurellaceae bacterium Macca]
MKWKMPLFTKGYSVRMRLVLFVITAVLLVLFISLSAVIGLNNTYHSLSDLRDRSQNQLLLSMTLGVKTTQISTYATRLSQTIRALEYQEASNQLEQHIEQVHHLLKDAKLTNQHPREQRFSLIVGEIEALESTVKELLLQAHQRHIFNTNIISHINQSLLHIRHIKRLAQRESLPTAYHSQLAQIENLIEESTHSSFSPNVFLSIQAIFSFLPPVSHQDISVEWQKVEQQFSQTIQQAKKLAEINMRIQFLTYKINALSKQIDQGYTQLAQEKIDDVKVNSEQVQSRLEQYQNTILFFALFTILLIIVLGFYIYHLIGKRLYSITQALTQLSNGDKTVRVPQHQKEDEIGHLALAFHIFYQQVITLDKTDALLKEKSHLLEQTYLAMRDGLAIFDAQLNLVSCNAQFSHLLNPEKPFDTRWNLSLLADFLCQRKGKIYATEQQVNVHLLQEMRVEQEPLEIALGQSILEWRISPLQDGGLVAFLIDRTQRKNLEMDLAHSQKMQSIGHLTGGIAHDFNNFLAVIIGNLDLIDPATLTEKQANRLQRAMKAAENSAILTQRLLAYARKQPLHPMAVNINQLLIDVADLVKHSLPASITLQHNLSEQLPPAYIDKNQLETALVNLIVNAKDAIESEGSITIETEYKLVQRTHRQEQMVQITIRDSGCGMGVETQKRVFEPFFTTKKQNKGSGLGLSMVYGFIRQSKGRIKIESMVGKGTTIYLQLPIASKTTDLSHIVPNYRAESYQGTLLLVEDQYTLRETLQEQLNLAGYHTISLESAEQAVEFLVKNADQTIDYLLSDISLTGMNGLQLAEYVSEYYPNIAILLMTGNQTAFAEKTPKFPLLNKPFKQSTLLQKLSALK